MLIDTYGKPYIAQQKLGLNTADMGWLIADNGRSCPPPAPKTTIVEGSPFADGDIDLTAWAGTRRYNSRTLAYKFVGVFGDYAEMYAAVDYLTSYLYTYLRCDLYDSIEDCTFHNVSVDSTGVVTEYNGLTAYVTVGFTADPYKTAADDTEVI